VEQRRFISFLLLALAVWLVWQALFLPPQQPRPRQPPAPGQAVEQEGPAGEDGLPAARQPAADGLPQIADANLPSELLTLGSLDPATGYRMLVTLTSQGAAVRRAELSSPRYLDQHDRSGYLGELELAAVDGGARVQAVGEGTPAKQAGIQVGDFIVGIEGVEHRDIASPQDFYAVLAMSRPGQQVTLLVRRGGAAPQPHAVTLVRRPFAVLRPEIENYEMRGVAPPAGFVERPSLLVMLAARGDMEFVGDEFARIAAAVGNGGPVSPKEQQLWDFSQRLTNVLEVGNWEVADRNATTVKFQRTLPELGLTLTKRYTLLAAPPETRDDLTDPPYDIRLDVELMNTSDAPQQVAYRIDGPTGMPLEGWWFAHKISQRWFSGAGLRDVCVRFQGGPAVQLDCTRIASGKVEPIRERESLSYAGVDGQYFSAVIIPQKTVPDEIWFDVTEAIVVGPKPDARTLKTFTNVTCRLSSSAIDLGPGESIRHAFKVFVGPKRPSLLAQYHAAANPDQTLIDLIYYGWPIFGSVAQAMLAILHFFHSIVGNYGIAIIMLTVLVRGAMFPLSYRATKSMTRLQALKPEMDRITEKYKTDMQARSRAVQELYHKHQINPLGGCLPMLLQMPIFIGLYKALMVDVELRGSPLLGSAVRWCSNLAAPDMLLDWSGMMPDFVNNGFGGPYLNVLPIITVVLFLITQKMAMPPATNEQMALQQKMMKYMTIFIGFLFYKVASGLCIYFIASSLWGIAERKLLKRATGGQLATTEAQIPGAPSRPARASNVTEKTSRNGGTKGKTKGSKPRRRR
jgi:YidC/Oxa1 family membrane protein insertase